MATHIKKYFAAGTFAIFHFMSLKTPKRIENNLLPYDITQKI